MHIARQPTSHVTGEQKVSSFSPARPVNKCMDGRSSVRRKDFEGRDRRKEKRRAKLSVPYTRSLALGSKPIVSGYQYP